MEMITIESRQDETANLLPISANQASSSTTSHDSFVTKTKITNQKLHEECKKGNFGLVESYLQNGACLDSLNENGETCLQVAIDNGKIDVITKIVLQQDKWKALLNKRSPQNDRSLFCELIDKFPDLAKIILDKCIETVGVATDINYKKIYHYELIEYLYDIPIDTAAEKPISFSKPDIPQSPFNTEGQLDSSAILTCKSSNELFEKHPLMMMEKYKREDLLNHELIQFIISSKWERYGGPLHWLYLFFYAWFVIFLTLYAGFCLPPSALPSDFFENLESPCNYSRNDTFFDRIPTMDSATFVFYILAWLFWIINVAKEIAQIYNRRCGYFKMLQNDFEICIYSLTFWFLFPCNIFQSQPFDCYSVSEYRWPLHWEVGAIAELLAWGNLIFSARRIPNFGIGMNAVMLLDVFITYTKFFYVFFLFIMMFAVPLFMLFKNQGPFNSLAETLVKTLVMMIGEFDYSAMFFPDASTVHYPIISKIIFTIFIMVMTILIMNVLIGLAVDDIQNVQSKAVLKRLKLQADFVLQMDYLMPMLPWNKFNSIVRYCGIQRQFSWRDYILGHEEFCPNEKEIDKFSRIKGDDTPAAVVERLYGNEAATKNDIQELINAIRLLQNDVIAMKSKSSDVKSMKSHLS